MLGESPIDGFIDLVENEVEEVESGDEGWWEINVLGDGLFTVVFRADGVGCCQDGCSSIEGRDDTCLGYGDGLLFL